MAFQGHALSLRRAVTGRSKPFDELLREHRDAKEASLAAKKKAKGLLNSVPASTKTSGGGGGGGGSGSSSSGSSRVISTATPASTASHISPNHATAPPHKSPPPAAAAAAASTSLKPPSPVAIPTLAKLPKPTLPLPPR